MPFTRIGVGLAVVVTAVVLVLGACSDDGSGASASADAGPSGDAGPPDSGPAKCRNAQREACPPAELEAYLACFDAMCKPEQVLCYGPDYKDGPFSGKCGAEATCEKACACDDLACKQKCTASAACTECRTQLVLCSAAKCPTPTCLTEVPNDSGARRACLDLANCCAKIVDPDTKAKCEVDLGTAGNEDANCAAIYPTFAPSCP